MLRISSHYFNVLKRISDQDDTIDSKAEFGDVLQNALALEFSTIPPYLSAAYSLDEFSNSPIRDLIIRIAKEEMLHMTVIANLMNAIGVAPQFTNKTFIPEFPYNPAMLDMSNFQLNIQSFSRNITQSERLVEDFFMRIEEPEVRGFFRVAMDFIKVARPRTIGRFYQDVIDIIEQDKIPGLFDDAAANSWKQLVAMPKTSSPGHVYPNFKKLNVDGTFKNYPLLDGYDLKITDKTSAVKFLKWIVDEGEGTSKDPIATEGLAAHFYRFESIIKHKNLIVDGKFPEGFAYSGAPLTLDTSDTAIWEFDKLNPKEEEYTGRLHDSIHEFNMTYSSMLKSLHAAFNATQESDIKPAYDLSKGAMVRLGKLAREIRTVATEEGGKKGGLPFQYIE